MAMNLDRIHIEITNICNVQCSFCPELGRPKHSMSVADYRQILAKVSPHARQVCLHLMGEPLIHPQLDEILECTEAAGAQINLTSNGILLQKKLDILLKHPRAVRQLNISLQAYSDNYPERDFMEYLKGICDCVDVIGKRGVDWFLNLRLWNVGHCHSRENELVFDYLEKRYGITINRKIDVGSIKSKKLFDKLYLHFDSRFDWPSLELPKENPHGTCRALKTHMGILTDGTVVPCCLDKEAVIKLGNIHESDLEKIFQSPRAQRMLQGFAAGELLEDLCRHCPYIERFSRKLANKNQ